MSTTNFVKSFRGRTTVYWVTTSLLALECLVGGIMGALQRPTFIDIMKHLGYPDYVMTIIGVWYVLGGVALLVPGFPLLKEWAYAGLFFIYTGGAIASRLAVGLDHDGRDAVVGFALRHLDVALPRLRRGLELCLALGGELARHRQSGPRHCRALVQSC